MEFTVFSDKIIDQCYQWVSYSYGDSIGTRMVSTDDPSRLDCRMQKDGDDRVCYLGLHHSTCYGSRRASRFKKRTHRVIPVSSYALWKTVLSFGFMWRNLTTINRQCGVWLVIMSKVRTLPSVPPVGLFTAPPLWWCWLCCNNIQYATRQPLANIGVLIPTAHTVLLKEIRECEQQSVTGSVVCGSVTVEYTYWSILP